MPQRTRAFIDCIRELYLIGNSIQEIAKIKDISAEEITEIVVDLKLAVKLKSPKTILGSKTEPYYSTEEEMLNPPIYKYDDLTKQERAFYESRTDM
jgi:hypothetical protein